MVHGPHSGEWCAADSFRSAGWSEVEVQKENDGKQGKARIDLADKHHDMDEQVTTQISNQIVHISTSVAHRSKACQNRDDECEECCHQWGARCL